MAGPSSGTEPTGSAAPPSAPSSAEPPRRPLALLVNDDGVHAPGLKALAAALVRRAFDVLVVAPASNQSGCSQSISLGPKLQLLSVQMDDEWNVASPKAAGQVLGVYSVSGRPADAAYLAVNHVLPVLHGHQADIILSGINDDANLGSDVFYSGTVGAAMCAHLQLRDNRSRVLVPALAISLAVNGSGAHPRPKGLLNFGPAAHWAADLAHAVLARRDLWHCVLNVNVPWWLDEKGLSSTDPVLVHTGHTEYTDPLLRDEDGRGTWRIMGRKLCHRGEGSDCHEFLEGRVTITPLRTRNLFCHDSGKVLCGVELSHGRRISASRAMLAHPSWLISTHATAFAAGAASGVLGACVLWKLLSGETRGK